MNKVPVYRFAKKNEVNIPVYNFKKNADINIPVKKFTFNSPLQVFAYNKNNIITQFGIADPILLKIVELYSNREDLWGNIYGRKDFKQLSKEQRHELLLNNINNIITNIDKSFQSKCFVPHITSEEDMKTNVLYQYIQNVEYEHQYYQIKQALETKSFEEKRDSLNKQIDELNKSKLNTLNQWKEMLGQNNYSAPFQFLMYEQIILPTSKSTSFTESVPADPKLTNILYKRVESGATGNKNLLDLYVPPVTGWLNIAGKHRDPENYETNYRKLQLYANNTGWCIAGEMAQYLEKGDFWLYFDPAVSTTAAVVAIRFDGDQIMEIQGRENQPPIHYYNEVTKFLNENNLSTDCASYRALEELYKINKDLGNIESPESNAKVQELQSNPKDTWNKLSAPNKKIEKYKNAYIEGCKNAIKNNIEFIKEIDKRYLKDPALQAAITEGLTEAVKQDPFVYKTDLIQSNDQYKLALQPIFVSIWKEFFKKHPLAFGYFVQWYGPSIKEFGAGFEDLKNTAIEGWKVFLKKYPQYADDVPVNNEISDPAVDMRGQLQADIAQAKQRAGQGGQMPEGQEMEDQNMQNFDQPENPQLQHAFNMKNVLKLSAIDVVKLIKAGKFIF